MTIESDHEPYNPGAALWKILPRNDDTAGKIDDAAQGLAGRAVALRRPRWRASTMRSMAAAPLPVTTRRLAPRARDRHRVLPFVARRIEEVSFPIGREHPKYTSWLPEGFA